jgi:hypothetical protein
MRDTIIHAMTIDHEMLGRRIVLTSDMKWIVNEQRLGFVATVSADGCPSVSPKGTFVVIDDEHIAFADIRSPGMIENLRANPSVEVNFVDPFVRKGYRFIGSASIAEPESDTFVSCWPLFERYGALCDKINIIVMIYVTRALPVITLVYDMGSMEDDLRRSWTSHFRKLQPSETFQE